MISDQSAHGVIYAKFGALSDAHKAFAELSRAQTGWSIEFILEKDFLALLRPDEIAYASESESVLTITAHYQGDKDSFDAGLVTSLVKDLLSTHGKISAAEILGSTYPFVGLRVELSDMLAARNILHKSPLVYPVRRKPFFWSTFTSMTNVHQGLHILVSSLTGDKALLSKASSTDYMKVHRPVIVSQPEEDDVSETRNGPTVRDLGLGTKASERARLQQPRVDQIGFHSNTSSMQAQAIDFANGQGRLRNTWPLRCSPVPGLNAPIDTRRTMVNLPWNLRPGAVGQERTVPVPVDQHWALLPQTPSNQGHTGLRRDSDFASCHHNVVDIERIRNGLDVRTTVSPLRESLQGVMQLTYGCRSCFETYPTRLTKYHPCVTPCSSSDHWQAMLKDIVDETSFGKYDFMYLRIGKWAWPFTLYIEADSNSRFCQ